MRSQDAVAKLNSAIDEWKLGHQGKIVIGIDGIAGAGKTTLSLAAWSGRKDTAVISLDCFAQRGGSIYRDWFRVSALKYLADRFRNNTQGMTTISWTRRSVSKSISVDFKKSVLIIDGVFLCDTDFFQNVFDKIIFLQASDDCLAFRRNFRTGKNSSSPQEREMRLRQFESFDRVWFDYCVRWRPNTAADKIICV